MNRTTIRTAALAAALVGLSLGAGACAKRQTTSSDQTIGGPAAPQPAASAPAAGTPETTASTPSSPAAPMPAAPAPVARGRAVQPGGPVYSLSDVFFGFDESTLTLEARSTLDQNATYLRQNPSARLQIEGHADERGSTAYNLALGDRRAHAARRYLESLGIEPTRLSTISYGEERPFAMGSNEEAWAQNRRGHFVEVR